ncbi:MAG: hypothetical protein HRT45_18425 [Bdellovibrionales bacterium]|nr:hypothetical protein [Bdellovibrionales bacterium]
MKTQSNCPARFREDVFERSFKAKPGKIEKVWSNLNRRETFVKGQLFPYRVEFDAAEQSGPFAEGELNIHHGPLLSVHGAIGKITDQYRGLEYFYGSYVLSFRLIRPVRLEFERDGEVIKLRLTTYVRPWVRPLWRGLNAVFWGFFGITFLF